MHRIHLTTLTTICAAVLAALPQDETTEGAASDRAPLLSHQQLGIAMHRLETEHSGLVTVLGVGTSRGERAIDALRIMAGNREPGRPAILVVANLDGTRAYESGIALDHARRLAAGYGADEEITRMLDTTTVYVVPRANPDAAEARFLTPLAETPATGQDVDNDRDGRVGEDGPADVNGDGVVAWMRVPDPEGTWMADPTDPRALVEASREAGQRGAWRLVPEGRDDDGDEEVAEDPVHDAVVNRNFPYLFAEHDPASGLFPTDEPETRALAELILAREDIALVLCYGAQDNLVEEPQSVPDDAPSVKRIPPPGVLESDAKLLAEIGKRYRALTENETKGSQEAGGSFQAWAYAHRGLPTLAVSLWSLPEEDPDGGAAGDEPDGGDGAAGEEAEEAASRATAEEAPEPSRDARHLAWIDAHPEEAGRFLPWTAFEHPELGAVEIGGFAPYARTEPPASARGALAETHLAFLIALAELLPRVEIVTCTARDLGRGLLEIEAAVENAAFLPLQTAAARRSRTVRPARVRIDLPEGARLVAGRTRVLVEDLPGSGGRHEVRWLVQGATSAAITVSVDTSNAGTDQAIPEVVQ